MLSCFVKHYPRVLVGLQLRKSQPELCGIGYALSGFVEEGPGLLGIGQLHCLLPEVDVRGDLLEGLHEDLLLNVDILLLPRGLQP